jgi:hypothetical protein
LERSSEKKWLRRTISRKSSEKKWLRRAILLARSSDKKMVDNSNGKSSIVEEQILRFVFIP